ncbi:hypothetical protein A2Y85_00630 [candidate division WOR-3 bacterium RBG_13_43_14]|uniref:Polymerase/histidinol phosphatase N-terminal domain-containing protein n=1 Tax=candidate division WOR-3 bacterium RBG_13_43_14 TaxID=1802590 RepID=A0A1F4U6S9_UNCW3|nr:MAG: hypothetical protein A2Y85_00630 [candidate division WOR-3 bacterium RBG_13_43_14]
MLRCYRCDLHIHTCLSPCADLTMSPKRIVKKARVKKLDIIGITDHNSAENVQATINAASMNNIIVWAGMEITSAEEAHLIALCDSIEAALKLQKQVYDALIPGENNEELFGKQIIVDEFDEIKGYNRRLLIGATTLTIEQIAKAVHDNSGVLVASHVDRESYSIIGQLGFIPQNLCLDAVEISPNMTIKEAERKIPETTKYPMITSSDAHFLKEIGNATTSFLLNQPTIKELHMALHHKAGRKIILES